MKRLFLATAAVFILASCVGAGPRTGAPAGGTRPLVTFVFDDGNDTDYLAAKDIFAKQGAVACAAITTAYINTRDHMTPGQILGLRDAGWEIMSHTVSHPHLTSLAPDELESEFSKSKASLEGLGLTVRNLVYPYNQSNALARKLAAKYYRSGRGGTNSLNAGAPDPFNLKSFTLKHDLVRMKGHIDRAYADKSWLIIYGHEINAQVKLSDKQGTFAPGETLSLKPSGTTARYVTVHWFPVFGFSLYLLPLSGTPQPGDVVTGVTSGATGRVDYVMYNELEELAELIGHVRGNYPDMRVVTIDQGLDLLAVPNDTRGAD